MHETRPDPNAPFSTTTRRVSRFGIAFVYTYVQTSAMMIAGLDWDDNNWPKCGKHGFSQGEIEEVLTGTPAVMPDPHPGEPRLRAIGRTTADRYIFLLFFTSSDRW